MSLKIGKKGLTAVTISLLASMAILTLELQLVAASSADSGNNSIQPFTHVFYIMMENHGDVNIIGDTADAPFINSLAANYGYDNNYFGVTHVSLPNYVAAVSGNNWYSYSDDPTQTFNHTNIIDQLVAHNISWKAYMESMPYAGFNGYWYPDNEPSGTSPSTTPSNALYALKHDPFMLFDDIRSDPQLSNNVVPLTQLTTDLQDNNVPQFVWISPNVCNDMHGQPPGPGATCPYTLPDSAQIQSGDNFLKQWVTAIMSSKAWVGNSVIFINWDEAEYPASGATAQQVAEFISPGPDSPIAPPGVVLSSFTGGVMGGGNVPMIVITTHMQQPITLNTWADHYNILRTIEMSWNLGYLGMASDGTQVQALTGFFQNHGQQQNSDQGIIQATVRSYWEILRRN
jgi:phosphatidylinositol-3-phosphatase